MRFRRALVGCVFASSITALAADAAANGFEFSENGTELMGRAGAWTARADNPLAAAYNPAGLAGQKTGLLLNSSFTWQQLCFKRAGTYSSLADPSGSTFDSSYFGDDYPRVCKNNGFGDVNVVPQVAFAYAATEKLGLGFAVVTPSAAANSTWPERVTTPQGDSAPSPARYLQTSQSAFVLFPTFAAGYEVAKGVRFGAAFQAVMAWFKFSSIVHAANLNKSDAAESPSQDLRADVSAKKLFTPAIVLGALISPNDDFDVGAMFRWSKSLHATDGDVDILGPAYGDNRSPATTGASSHARIGDLEIPQPWEIRVGARWHPARAGGKVVESGKRRDVLASDAFDVELDLTYAHNSSFDQISVMLPYGEFIALGDNKALRPVPRDASQPHQWKDNVGIRVGGEYPLLPDRLGVRAGVFYQTRGQDPQYLNIDFVPSELFGLYLGGTVRVTPAFDVAVGYGHIFAKGLDNGGDGKLYAVNSSQRPANGVCPGGGAPNDYRSCYPVNSGKVTTGYNTFSVGGTVRF